MMSPSPATGPAVGTGPTFSVCHEHKVCPIEGYFVARQDGRCGWACELCAELTREEQDSAAPLQIAEAS
jgi:hypothetical protein